MKKWMYTLVISGLLMCGVSNVQASDMFCGMGTTPCASSLSQSSTLFNSQTTGGAVAAVVVTVAAVVGSRTHVYSVEGRCNTAANTSGITITDGGTTIWSTVATEVLAANNFVRNWTPALTGSTNSATVITLAACAAGTGTLIVEADRY